MRINFLGLQAFLNIAEHGSFRRAAQHLNLSQTAISHRIKTLEDDLGLKLMARTSRELTLTKAGVELMAKAKVAIADLEGTFESVRQQGIHRRRRLSIACLPDFALYWLPPALSKFRSFYPDLEIRIFEVSSYEIAGLLQREEVEFGLSVVSTNRWDLEIEPLIKSDPMVLACQPAHALAHRRRVKWTDLRGMPMIRVGTNTSIRAIIDDALEALHEEFDWRYEVQHVETAVSLVEKGCGVTIVPRCNIELHGSSAVVAIPISTPTINCAFGVVTRRGAPLSPIVEHLKGLLMESIDSERRKHE